MVKAAGHAEPPDDAARQFDRPGLQAKTSQGDLRFYEGIEDGWAILCSHPKDFMPVRTTELGFMDKLKPEFDKANTKIVGLRGDPVDNQHRWAKDIEAT